MIQVIVICVWLAVAAGLVGFWRQRDGGDIDIMTGVALLWPMILPVVLLRLLLRPFTWLGRRIASFTENR